MEASGDGGTVFVGTALVDVRVEAGSLSPGTGGGNTPECGVPGPGGVVKLKEGEGKDDLIEEEGDGVAERIGLKLQDYIMTVKHIRINLWLHNIIKILHLIN